MSGHEAEIKQTGREAGLHQDDAGCTRAAGEPDQRQVGGMAGSEDKVGKREMLGDVERLLHATQHSRLPAELDAVQRG
ncbi:MAG: hypothetical protein CFE26_07735 [Verrucomicrobiales bacterium VVV1]|nr:MAG: hypothetical protein CFE26_07735 [Verrucomicrobiales bacterium VVV1]